MRWQPRHGSGARLKNGGATPMKNPATTEWRRLRPGVIIEMTLDRRRRGRWPARLRWVWDGPGCLVDARGRKWQWRLQKGLMVRRMDCIDKRKDGE